MDIERIQEIVNTSELINVHYEGTPVFIQQVHPDTETATVFMLNNLTNKQVVAINALTEDTIIQNEEWRNLDG